MLEDSKRINIIDTCFECSIHSKETNNGGSAFGSDCLKKLFK